MTTVEMSTDEISTFAAKLDAFGSELSSKEQALLREILMRAARYDAVQGYGVTASLGWGDEVGPADILGEATSPFGDLLGSIVIHG